MGVLGGLIFAQKTLRDQGLITPYTDYTPASYMPVMLAVMEIPGCLVGLAQISRLRRTGMDRWGNMPDEPGYMDAVFCYDPSLMTDGGAILLRPGKPQRVDEVAFHARTYAANGIPILGAIEAPGTFEGGDTLWIDERTLAVGRGYRTNRAGIEQLQTILGALDVTVIAYDLAHYHGPGECLHLMSFISPVAEKLAVVYLPLMPVQLVEDLRECGWDFIDVPDEEFESMACNVLALRPRMVVAMDGNPVTRARMEAAGCTVQVYPGDEISYNRAGGPTCLSRPLWRKA
jgi:N-dimethylarginine dimethylaminohydrolase